MLGSCHSARDRRYPLLISEPVPSETWPYAIVGHLEQILQDLSFDQTGHWWFRGRQSLFASILRDYVPDPSQLILDIGSSAGPNLQMFADNGYRNSWGLEISASVANRTSTRIGKPLIVGDAMALPIRDGVSNAILLTDVIEHLEDDVRALREAVRVAKPGAIVLVTVPAFPLLWSSHDEINHHHRRYVKKDLKSALLAADLSVERIWYFNFFSFPAALIARKFRRRTEAVMAASLSETNFNNLIARYFRLECAISRRIQLPVGVSLAAICRVKN